MWDITLQILSAAGSVVLVFLGVLLFFVLLFLFFPVTYRLEGKKTPEEFRVSAGAGWLFGLLRLKYSYPEPGKLTVKVLWKTVFDSSQKKENGGSGRKTKKRKGGEAAESGGNGKPESEKAEKPEEKAQSAKTGKAEENTEKTEGGKAGKAQETGEAAMAGESAGQQESGTAHDNPEPSETGEPPGAEEDSSSRTEEKTGILEKAGKIRYTIQQKCDKIKEIRGNLSYYTQLLQEENTARLWRHVRLRLGKILRSIRPRRIRAELLFGAASPDTTGYVYGFYCMFSPALGGRVAVTPDFTRAVLEGEAEIAGYVTGAVFVWNALRLLLDRKLHLFVKKIKAGRKRDGR